MYAYLCEAIKPEFEPNIRFFDIFAIDLILDENINPYYWDYARTPFYNPKNEIVK